MVRAGSKHVRASVPRETWLSLLNGAQEQISVLVFSGTFFVQSNPHVAKICASLTYYRPLLSEAGYEVRLHHTTL